MSECKHRDCFANTDGRCHALTSAYKEKCPFKKTLDQIETERRRTAYRLYSLGGVKK